MEGNSTTFGIVDSDIRKNVAGRRRLETIYGSAVLRPTRVGFLVRPKQENLTVRQTGMIGLNRPPQRHVFSRMILRLSTRRIFRDGNRLSKAAERRLFCTLARDASRIGCQFRKS